MHIPLIFSMQWYWVTALGAPLPDILNEFDCFNLDILLLGIVTVISDNFFKI